MSDNPTVAPEAEDELLSSHNYDGIQEYDNPTPGWWNWLFIATIVFAPIYILWIHSPVDPHTLDVEYKKAYDESMKLKFGELGDLEPTQANIVKYMHDPEWLPVGEATFSTHCKSCHGAEGQGIPGSGANLTDDRYLHVKEIEDIATVIHDGAKNGAMPAWGTRLHPNEIVLAAAYVASLRGNNVEGGKTPDGDPIPPWPEPAENVESKSDKSEGEEHPAKPAEESADESADSAEPPSAE